jgi:hypothetical protein
MTISEFRFTIVNVMLASLFVASGFCHAGEPNGLIEIEGKHIKRLVLSGEHSETFNEPNESITLPIGTYQIAEIELQGGYISRQYNLPKNVGEITVKEGESAVLKLGDPLTQRLKIVRCGNSLQLSYNLQGIGGEDYEQPRNNAPQFAVYKGDVQIGSGTFSYG